MIYGAVENAADFILEIKQHFFCFIIKFRLHHFLLIGRCSLLWYLNSRAPLQGEAYWSFHLGCKG